MSENTISPGQMSFKGNIASNWRLWKQKFEIYLIASGKSNKSDDVKIAILLNLLSDEGIEIYNTFEYDQDNDAKKFEVVLKKFDEYCQPLKNIVFEHFKFFKRDQLAGESFDQFVTALKQLANSCEFKERDTMILDRIVLGIRDSKMQEKLLQEPNLTLEHAITVCRAMETSSVQQKEIARDTKNGDCVTVDAINRFRRKQAFTNYRDGSEDKYNAKNKSFQKGVLYDNKRRDGASGVSCNIQHNNTDSEPGTSNCKKCGLKHSEGKCPAYNRYCSRCKKKGHYRRYCKTKGVHEINEYETDSDSDCDYCDYSSDNDSCLNNDSSNTNIVWTISTVEPSAKPVHSQTVNTVEWFENILVQGQEIKFKIDTGSQVNVLNKLDFQKLGIPISKINKIGTKLTSYSGHMIDTMGLINLECSYKNVSKKLPFYVLRSDKNASILGLNSTSDLKILLNKTDFSVCSTVVDSVSDIVSKYKNVFSGIGKVKKTYSITLRENAYPVIASTRKIPAALKQRVKEKLDEMVAENIIMSVSEPTD